MNNNENANKLLDAAYKNVRMASYAIDCLIEKIENEKLVELVRKQNKFYLKIVTDLENLSKSLNYTLTDVNPFLKGMSFMSIKTKTLMNNDSSKFADMLIQGTTMGITDSIKAKKDNRTRNEEINNVVDDIISHEEKFVESLKKFL